MQAKLQEKRTQKATEDRSEAEKLSTQLEGLVLNTLVKVDPEGHMYGSVGISDVMKLFEQEGHIFNKNYLTISQPFKRTGVFELKLNLNEGVECRCQLKIQSEDDPQEEPTSNIK
jgi:large subunit ribosomal protein L9